MNGKRYAHPERHWLAMLLTLTSVLLKVLGQPLIAEEQSEDDGCYVLESGSIEKKRPQMCLFRNAEGQFLVASMCSGTTTIDNLRIVSHLPGIEELRISPKISLPLNDMSNCLSSMSRLRK